MWALDIQLEEKYAILSMCCSKELAFFSLPLSLPTFYVQRVHLDISVGEHAVDYQQVQAKDKLSELQLRIRQLLDQVEQITKEQNYQRVTGPFPSCLPLTLTPHPPLTRLSLITVTLVPTHC